MDEVQNVPAVLLGGVVYRMPFRDALRPLSADEANDLRVSVEGVGVQVPVYLYDSPTYGENCVIDGHHRLMLSHMVGMGCPVQKFDVSDDFARRMAVDLNAARRQLTRDEIREARAKRVAKVAELRQEGKSLRAIADEVGVSLPQVRRDLGDAEDAGVPPGTPDRVTGQDGKSYPATQPAPEPEPEDRGDAWEPPEGADGEPEPLNGTLPQPAFDASKRPPQKWMKGGSNVDPDHDYADILNKLTTLTAAITVQMNKPEDNGRMRQALTELSTILRKTHMVLYTSDVIDGELFTAGKAKFIGFGPFRRILRTAGKRATPMKQKDVAAAFDAANNPNGDEE